MSKNIYLEVVFGWKINCNDSKDLLIELAKLSNEIKKKKPKIEYIRTYKDRIENTLNDIEKFSNNFDKINDFRYIHNLVDEIRDFNEYIVIPELYIAIHDNNDTYIDANAYILIGYRPDYANEPYGNLLELDLDNFKPSKYSDELVKCLPKTKPKLYISCFSG